MIPIAKPQIGIEEENEILTVLRSGQLATGEEVIKLEKEFGEKFGYKHVIATSSGTTALVTALWALGIGEGDEVITTPFTFIASANSILATGAKPVFADIDPLSYNIDPLKIESKITSKTKAIMPVHLYGLPCYMDQISKIAKKYKLHIVEDACQAHGAKYKGKYVGSWGVACFSLYPTKNVTSAEGGLITTKNIGLATKMRRYINHGQEVKYLHTSFGLNYRLTNIHAAIGLAQVRKIDHFTCKRQENAQFLTKNINGVQLPFIPENTEHVFHQYTVRIPKNRDKVMQKLTEVGIGCGVHYPTPLHKQPFYLAMGYKDKMPEAEKASAEVLSLPVHPGLSKEDLITISREFNKIVSSL